ncbi:MAG: hypothetical protein U0790_20700 [Isosphaeraceae bacterium]
MNLRISGGMVRFGLPGLFLGAALSWTAGGPEPLAAAQTRAGRDPSSGGNVRAGEVGKPQGQVGPGRPLAGGDANGTLALVTSTSGSVQWLYLIDTRTQAFAVYRVDPTNPKGSVKLEAARQYQWDLKLEHYNNQAPEPAAIESTVKALAQPTTR